MSQASQQFRFTLHFRQYREKKTNTTTTNSATHFHRRHRSFTGVAQRSHTHRRVVPHTAAQQTRATRRACAGVILRTGRCAHALGLGARRHCLGSHHRQRRYNHCTLIGRRRRRLLRRARRCAVGLLMRLRQPSQQSSYFTSLIVCCRSQLGCLSFITFSRLLIFFSLLINKPNQNF